MALRVATLALSASVPQPLFGALGDRLGARLIAAGGVALAATVLSLLGVAPTVGTLFLLLVVGGIGSAACHPIGAAFARGAGADRPSVAQFGACR